MRFVVLLSMLISGCGLNVTNERPSYSELGSEEQAAVQTILKELRRFDAQLKVTTGNQHNIQEVLDLERIHVSFEGLIFSANLGDDLIHVAVWENLGAAKQALIQSWFKASTPQGARAVYVKLFYQFLAVVQGVKQFLYNLHTPAWVFQHRSLYSIERDSVRTALAHYVKEGRQQEMWPFLKNACTPVLSQYAAAFSSKFSKKYLQRNFGEIFDPDDPTGYMYFMCRWIEMGMQEAEGLGGEVKWLIELQ
jgi:hypothetical protein